MLERNRLQAVAFAAIISCSIASTTVVAQQCPANAHVDRVEQTGNARTVHCKCDEGFKNVDGACVRSGAGIISEEEKQSLKDQLRERAKPPQQHACVDKQVKTVIRHGFVQLNFSTRRCLPNIYIAVCIWKNGVADAGTGGPVTGQNLEVPTSIQAGESFDGYQFAWTTYAKPCEIDPLYRHPFPKAR